MFSEKRENWVLRDNLQPVCFCFWISITGRVLYPVRIVEMERGTSSKGGCCELLLADAARPCSSRLEFEILCKFFNCKGMWPSREPCWLSSRFILTWKVRTICIILKLKRVFIPLLTRKTTYICTCYENKVLSPIRTYLIIAFQWILGSLSRAWIVFHQSNSILPNYTLLHLVLIPCKKTGFNNVL